MFARYVGLTGLVLLAVGGSPAAAQTGHEGHEFGSVHFEISCSADSQQQFDRAVAEDFAYPENRHLILHESDPERLLDLMERYDPPKVQQWIDSDEA